MADLGDYIAAMLTDMTNTMTYFMNARLHLYQLGDAIAAQNWPFAKSWCYACADDLGIGIAYWLQDAYGYHGYAQWCVDALTWIDDNWPEGGGLDMDTLLSTMVTADVDQVTYFVGLVDAYRVGVWDRPFNEEFFAALARGWAV